MGDGSTTFLSYREESRKNYGRNFTANQTAALTIEQMSAGAMLRIADSLEVIAKDRKALIEEVDELRKRNKRLEEANLKLSNDNYKEKRRAGGFQSFIKQLQSLPGYSEFAQQRNKKQS